MQIEQTAAMTEALGVVTRYFQQLSEQPPNRHPHNPNGSRPFSTGDVRFVAENLTALSAYLAALSARPDDSAEIARLRAENAALRGKPGLPDDWVCDDHGTFGCRKCMSPIQLAALGGE